MKKSGSNDLKMLGDLYRTMKLTLGSEDFEECLREGAAAVGRRKAGGLNGFGSFGPRRRQVQQFYRNKLIVAARASAGEAATSMDSILDRADANDDEVEDVIDTVRSIRREAGTLAATTEHQHLQALIDFRQENLAEVRSTLAGVGLAETANNYIPVPSPVHGVKAIAYDPHTAGDLAGDLLSCRASAGSQSGNIFQHCDTSWSNLNRDIGADESGPSSEADSDNYDGPCWVRQTCMCGVDDERVDAIRNRVLRLCKISMPFSGDIWKREALGSARIILKFIPELPPCEDGDQDVAAFWGLDEDFRYLHISSMSFSPYCPMVQVAEEASDADALGAARAHNEVAIKVGTRCILLTKANECANGIKPNI